MEHVEIGNYIIYSDGRIFSKKKNDFKLPYPNGSGYLQIRLNGEQDFVHRLIAKHFIQNPENKKEVNHKDGDKANNTVENLEWVTRLENVKHSWDTGLSAMRRGEKNPGAKLDWDRVKQIREIGRSLSIRKIAKMFGVGHTAVSCILKNKTWVVQL